MLNTYNELEIHAVSGTLIKSHPKSKFRRFDLKSSYAYDVWKGVEKIVPLQFMLCGEGQVLMEYVDRCDWVEKTEQTEPQNARENARESRESHEKVTRKSRPICE